MKVFELLKQSDPAYRRSFWFFSAAYFFVQFNYPLIRASSTSFFFEAFGAKSSPKAMVLAVFCLSISILVCNKLQAKRPVQQVFFGASFFSVLVFSFCTWGILRGIKDLVWAQFIWKEVYIMIQVHVLLAFANNHFKKEDFRILLGPVGAAGSLGGIFGGLLTSFLSGTGGTGSVMLAGIVGVIAPAIFFLLTPTLNLAERKELSVSPLASLRDGRIGRYVFLIGCIVALTQFIINIADFRFHVELEAAITDSAARTSYLGNIYSLINVLTLLFQLFILPYVLPRVSEKNYQLFIPLSYFVCVASLMAGSSVGLLPVAGLYAYFKAADYSLFTAGKELLYQPLSQAQKYGAKYLTDMLVYRAGKAMVAAVLIYLQSSTILNVLMLIFLLIWIVLVIQLFHLHKKLIS